MIYKLEKPKNELLREDSNQIMGYSYALLTILIFYAFRIFRYM